MIARELIILAFIKKEMGGKRMAKDDERRTAAAVMIGALVGGIVAWALSRYEHTMERYVELPDDEIPNSAKKPKKKPLGKD